MQGKFECKWDKGVTIKFFIKFLKANNCMPNLYEWMSTLQLGQNNSYYSFIYPMPTTIGRLYINYGLNKKRIRKNEPFMPLDDLILSQLWKFYVLERIEMYPQTWQSTIIRNLKNQITSNGCRDDYKLKKLFKKHGLALTY